MNIEEITGLEDELASKAPVNHTHSTSEVDGLVEALAGKAETVHSHSTAQVTGLTTALASKANVSHTHTTSQVAGLDTLLAGKANLAHTHLPANVTGLDTLLAGKADSIHNHNGTQITGTLTAAVLPYGNLTGVPATFAPAAHTHPSSDVLGLDTLLGGKADSIHDHTVSDVSGLDSLLSGKASVSHTHETDEIVDLDDALNARAPLVHTHDLDDVTGLETLIAGKANLTHTHPTSAIDNLDTLLAGKAQIAHTHTISDIESLEAALAERSAEGHTHDIDEITGLPLALQDKADLVHLHTPANVTGLDTLLAGKAPLAHTHSTVDINGLSDALASKAAATHLHSVNDITGFVEAVQAAAPANNNASLLTTGTLDDDRLPDNVVLDGDSRLSDARSPLSHSHASATIEAPGFMSAADKFKLENLVQTNPVNADWNASEGGGLAQILNKPAVFPPATHNHDPATIFGQSDNKIPVKFIPALPRGTTVFASSFSGLSVPQQDSIVEGVYVVLTDGRQFIYTGQGSKISQTSYILISDSTPDWSTITGKPGDATTLAGGLMSVDDKIKLNNIASNAEVNVNADWNAASGDAQILNKPTLGTAASRNVGTGANDVATGTHTHDPATIFGSSPNKIPVQFLPALPSGNQIVSSGGLAQLTSFQLDDIDDGAIVVLTDGRRLIYTGSGSKTAESSYILLSDATPDWSTITGRPGLANATLSGFMSSTDFNKLFSISSGAEANVQSDWSVIDTLSDAFVKNKPTLGTAASRNVGTGANDVATGNHTHSLATDTISGFMSAPDYAKLGRIADRAQVNVQSDWSVIDTLSDAFVKNKPTLGTAASRNVGAGANDVATGTHTHDPATIFGTSTNKIPLQNIPALPSQAPIVSSGAISNLTLAQQNEIVTGSIVITIDGRRFIYKGSQSKTLESSYILLSDATPDWSTITGRPGDASTLAGGLMSVDDKIKLNNIASNAEVNVNADWNAASGDAQILNKPTLGTAAALAAPTQGNNASSTQVVLGNDTRLQAATDKTNGLLTVSNYTKLAGLSNYTHPAGDGNRHVPATGTANNGKFLKAGATAASESWALIGLGDLAQSGAQVGQIPKWNGTNWAPSADAGGIQGTGVSAIVKLTQSEYAALGNNVSPTTFYIVT